ncbi:hypothetical protein GWC77_27895 [Paraburkholderia sp. NMBU_R16]|uniref:hypothetical protein n=1 Tax=Paraburkholderia sp. NMBU_R16 TaxID=2698676 RepID=UPI001563817E|nr:hypothetical protein [Paraburkholderia sp. NMBU_R16]NRO99670.1 hypothetical protein [Paraburkholderia sp. NMBU_R16]
MNDPTAAQSMKPPVSKAPTQQARPIADGPLQALNDLQSRQSIEGQALVMRRHASLPTTPLSAAKMDTERAHVTLKRSTNRASEAAFALVAEPMVHGITAFVIWGLMSNSVNSGTGANSTAATNLGAFYRGQISNVGAMIPISYITSLVLFPMLRGLLGYKIDEAKSSDPALQERLTETQGRAAYSSFITELACGLTYGGALALSSKIPFPPSLGDTNAGSIIPASVQVTIAAAAVAMIHTVIKLRSKVDGH